MNTDHSSKTSFSIDGHTRLTGLLGSPVSHSMSPKMHNDSFQILGLNYAYLCFDVDEAHLETAVQGLRTCGIRGFNLTMPDKNRMAELADELSPAARLIGAVNTVVNDNGRLIGHNTDGVGFMRSLQDYDFDIRGKEMTILGAGGAATAIIAQAALDGCRKLHVFARPTSRFHARTVALLDEINRTTGCRADLQDMADHTMLRTCLNDSALLVNGTPVGMAPDTEASPLPDVSLLHKDLFAADIIYNPRETLFLKQAGEAGCRTCNGLYMLLYQGAEAFRLWTGEEMPTEIIKERYFK
ncbi:MAG: shikimate dehydrogenase [Eubacteriales bacterium]|nr:shikimate dehydrogenase [Eubacteriales bacterium]